MMAFTLAVHLTGCGLRVMENSPQKDIKSFSQGCLNGLKQKLELYIKGELTVKGESAVEGESKLNEIAQCVKTALLLFKERVHGKKKGEFTPSELRKFLQGLFLQDKVISDALLSELMRLKTIIIGGPEDRLTEVDIEKFIIFVEVLIKEAIFFQPYVQALNNPADWKKISDKDSLREIEEDLQESIVRISIFTQHFSNPYFFSDIKTLTKELILFFDYHESVIQLDKKIRLISVLKQFFVGGSEAIIQPDEWGDILLTSAYLASAGFNYTLLKNQNSFISPEGIKYVFVVLNDLLSLLDLAIKNRPNKIITESDFLKVFAQLKLTWPFMRKLSKHSGHNLLLIFLGKIFNVEKNTYGTVQLTSGQMKLIQRTVQSWMEIQSFLNSIYGEKNFDSDLIISKIKPSFFSTKELFQGGKDIMKQLFSLKPLYRNSNKVYLSREIFSKEANYKHDYKNLTIYNFYYSVAEMLKMGYEADYPDGLGTTQEELNNFFNDFQPIGEDLGWLRSDTGSPLGSGEAEFLAANMLTATAEGFNPDWTQEEYLTSKEIVEYLAYAFSFGLSIGELETSMSKMCLNDKSVDAQNYNKAFAQYEIECVKVHLVPVLAEHMDNMPDLQEVVKGMSGKEKLNFADALMHISFETEEQYQQAAHLTRSNFKNIIMALYFVETTMDRYDLNKDLTLQNDEIWQGFPMFKGYLSRVLVELLCRDSDDMAASVYAYVIKKKNLPTSDDRNPWDKMVAWVQLHVHDILKGYDIDYWELYLDREQLTRVFSSVIKGFLRKKEASAGQSCASKEKQEHIHFNDYVDPTTGFNPIDPPSSLLYQKQ